MCDTAGAFFTNTANTNILRHGVFTPLRGFNDLSIFSRSKLNKRSKMANTENLKEAIKEMMVEKLMLRIPKEKIPDDMPLFGPQGLGLDSIDALELVVSLEKQFGVTIPSSEVAKTALATVNSIHDYVLVSAELAIN